jgi:hypothetical protein
MEHSVRSTAVLLFLACDVAGAMELPNTLRPAADEAMILEGYASGVQIYECISDAESYVWKFRAPLADLVDRDGHPVARHYAGPTWEAVDGSRVVGFVRVTASPSRSDAIPQLVLGAKSTAGPGVLSRVRTILRLDTLGGQAPNHRCDHTALGEVANVRYSATYRFFAPAR